MLLRLDDHINGENSLKAQKHQKAVRKKAAKKAKTKKKLELLAAEREQSAAEAADPESEQLESEDDTLGREYNRHSINQ